MRALMIVATAVLAVPAGGQETLQVARTGQRLSVSVRPIYLAKGERITEFTLTVVQGHVESVVGIPLDWSLSVDVDPAWKAVVSGGCLHGVGGLTSSAELPSITLEVLDLGLGLGPPFSLTATAGIDFEGSTTSGPSAVTRTLRPWDLLVKAVATK
jgi:hypothetical protein